MYAPRRGITLFELIAAAAFVFTFAALFVAVSTHKEPPTNEITIFVEKSELDNGICWIFAADGAPFQVGGKKRTDSLQLFGRLKEHHSYKVKVKGCKAPNSEEISTILEIVQEVE